MRDAFTMRFRNKVAEFVQPQASVGNRRVTSFVETLPLREKARFWGKPASAYRASVTDLLWNEQQDLIRGANETHAVRGAA